MKKLESGALLKAGLAMVLAFMLFISVSTASYFVEMEWGKIAYPLLYVVAAVIIAGTASWFFRFRERLFLTALAALSLIISLVLVFWAKSTPVSDFRLLYSLSDALSRGDYETLRNTEYFTNWAYQSFFVMYQALVLKVFPGELMPLLVFNSIFRTGIVALVYLIARQAYGSKTAIFVSVLYLLYPAPYLLLSVLTNQHISLFFCLLGIYIFIKKQNIPHMILSGALIALGNAYRPDGQIVIAALAVYMILTVFDEKRDKIVKYAACVMPVVILIITYILLGAIISFLVIATGVNPNGQKNSDPLWKLVLGLNVNNSGGGYSSELATTVFSVKDPKERHKIEKKIIAQHLSVDKKEFLMALVDKTESFWQRQEETVWAFGDQYTRNVPIINRQLGPLLNVLSRAERVFFFMTVSITALSAAVLFRLKKQNVSLVLCGIVIMMFFGIYIFIEIQSRYKYFIMPFIFILAGAGIEGCVNNIKAFVKFMKHKNYFRKKGSL